MRAGPGNLITDVEGILVGNAEDRTRGTGVTVLTAARPLLASVSVQGGAPGTRETDLLAPEATVERIDAVVLTGGSAFGLSAADGVMDALRRAGRGYPAGQVRIPIVPAAVLIDFYRGLPLDWETPPWVDLGRRAFAAAAADFALGTAGAGTGAMVATLRGGLGSASAVLEEGAAAGAVVGALAAVNAVGTVLRDGGPEFRAGGIEIGEEFGGLGTGRRETGLPPTKVGAPANSVPAIVATDMALTKAEAKRVAIMAHDGLARAIAPVHMPQDGDTVFAVSTGTRKMPADRPLALWQIGHLAAETLARAVTRGVYEATALDGDPKPAWRDVFSREARG